MQSVSSRIWTRVTVSILCDDNHYTMGTSVPYSVLQVLQVKSSWCKLALNGSNVSQLVSDLALWRPLNTSSAQSAGAVEYTDCISAMSVLVYDIKQSDGEAPVMLELWGMLNTPSLPLFPGPLWPKMVALDRFLSIGQIEMFDI